MESIVLARKNIRESDQIISVYTKEKGKLELLARGVKKITSKNSAHLEPFSFVDIDIAPGKGIDHLTKVQPINYFVNIRNDLQKSLAAGYVVSLLDKILHAGEKDERLFVIILSWLEYLNLKFTAYDLRLVDGFIVKLLNCLGYDITQVVGLDVELKISLEILKNSDWSVIAECKNQITENNKLHDFIYNFLVEKLERKVKDWSILSTPLLRGEGSEKTKKQPTLFFNFGLGAGRER